MTGRTTLLSSSLLVGCAHHRIILDDEGVPCDYEFLEVDPAFERITGLSSAALVGHRARQAIPAIDKESFDWISCFGSVALAGGDTVLEYCAEEPARRFRIHVYSTAKLFFSILLTDLSGDQPATLVTQGNRAKADTAPNVREPRGLQRWNRMHLETIVENQPGLLWLKGEDGRFLAVNAAFAAFCGRAGPEAVVGLRDEDLWPQDLAAKYRADDAEVMASGVSKTLRESTANQGEERWFETFKSPVRDDKGRVVGTTGCARDVSEWRRAEDKLRQRESELQRSLDQVELFRTMVESSGDCFYLLDLNDGGRMCYVNKAAERHFGASREELCTWHIQDWDPGFRTEMLPGLIKTIEQKKTLHLTSRHRTATGAIVPVEITVNYMETPAGPRLAYGWFSDISARLAAEAELRNARQQAETASRAKSEFLAKMSHEIRTPLNGIIGFADLLRETPLSSAQQQYIDCVSVSARSLLGIVNDILDFSKIEAGMMTLEAVRTDLIELLRGTVDMAKVVAAQKNLVVRLDIAPTLPRFAMVDPVRLRQILANLLGNAVKFTEQGEVALHVVHELGEGGKTRFRISVRDTGIGITEAQRDRLFKAFSQADASTTRRFGGTGLGLVISDMLVQRMGSKLSVESTPGKGSTFSFDLTTETDDGPEARRTVLRDTGTAMEGGIGPQARPGQPCCKILVAEDIALNMMLAEALIRKLHPSARIYKATNGSAAVEQYEKEHPDLILMDVQMPQMDGLEASRAIRALETDTGRHARIVALTAGAFSEEQERCLAAGMDEFLAKPIEPEKLQRVLDRTHALQGRLPGRRQDG